MTKGIASRVARSIKIKRPNLSIGSFKTDQIFKIKKAQYLEK